MKIHVVAFMLCCTIISNAHAANTRVKGYNKQNGTYVQPYVKTSPNATRIDNYSTKGNANTYSGRSGTVDPYAAPKPSKSNWER